MGRQPVGGGALRRTGRFGRGFARPGKRGGAQDQQQNFGARVDASFHDGSPRLDARVIAPCLVLCSGFTSPQHDSATLRRRWGNQPPATSAKRSTSVSVVAKQVTSRASTSPGASAMPSGKLPLRRA